MNALAETESYPRDSTAVLRCGTMAHTLHKPPRMLGSRRVDS